MTLQHDKILVVDIEATCWERFPPPGQQNEIIEIGVCAFDLETLEPSDKRSLLVKPARSKVSPFCTQLTTLTQEQVDTGMAFAAACAVLEQDYAAKERLWVSWGNYDLKMFRAQCDSFCVPYPLSGRHVNLKKVFGKYNVHKAVGMAKALEIAGLALEGTHHRGDDDAWNISRLAQHLIRQHGNKILK